MAERMTPQKALDVIQLAARDGKLAMIETTLRATGEKVQVLIGVDHDTVDGVEGTSMVPLALMIKGDAFELLDPPFGARVIEPDDTEGGDPD